MAEEARLEELGREVTLWRERSEGGLARLRELEERKSALQAELAQFGEAPAGLAQQEQALESELADAKARGHALERTREGAEAELAAREARLEQAEAERLEARETGARLEAQLERARAEDAAAETAWRERAPSGPVEIPDEAPGPDELAALEERLSRLVASRERLGPVNLRAVDEAAELELRLQTLQSERDELTGAIERLRRAIASLNREGRERLHAAFAQVERHFEAIFARLFGGGQARLALTDLEDPLAAGLELAASPPGKKLQSLSLLSGGEKALTALALVFAVFLTRPSPLCILDEVDAPLDDANVERLADLLEELALGTRTRFVVVTHHPLTMARMDRLYGVTMLERGVSQLVSVDLGNAMALRATA
jgi:chromosome segregation protein